MLADGLLRLLHPVDHLIARRAAWEIVGVRQQRAFARLFLQRARENVVVLNAGNDLLRGQTFRNGDGVLHHLALDDVVGRIGDAAPWHRRRHRRKPVAIDVPKGITVLTPDPTNIVITGADKQAVGQFAAVIRKVRPPEPYKGKGIRYEGEHVRRKAGKAFASGG